MAFFYRIQSKPRDKSLSHSFLLFECRPYHIYFANWSVIKKPKIKPKIFWFQPFQLSIARFTAFSIYANYYGNGGVKHFVYISILEQCHTVKIKTPYQCKWLSEMIESKKKETNAEETNCLESNSIGGRSHLCKLIESLVRMSCS